MNRPAMADWIKALQSGEYEQTAGALQLGDSYCCLGVLCKIAPEDIVVLEQYDIYSSGIAGENLGDQAEVRRWIYLPPGEEDVLIDMNDAGNFDFYNIAEHLQALLDRDEMLEDEIS